MTHRSALPFILAASVVMLLPARSAEISKADNTLPLNDPASWVQNQVPGPTDIALFDSTIAAALTVELATIPPATLSWDGIRVFNPTGAVIIGHDDVNTLGIGAIGIDMSAASAVLLIEGGISINAPQTWTVANASTAGAPYPGHAFNHNEDLSFSAQHAPVGLPMNLNGHTVSTVGAGTIVITSGYTISNGTFIVGNPVFVVQGGANRLTTIDPNVTVRVNAGSIFRLQTNSGPITSGAITQLDGGTLNLVLNNATNPVTVSGPVNVLNPSTLSVTGGLAAPVVVSGGLQGSADLTVNNAATNAALPVLTFSGDNSAFSGTLTLSGTAGSRRARLASATAGSAAARWVVNPGNVLQVDGVAVNLGTLNGAGTVTNSSANPAMLTVGAGTFTGLIENGVGGPMGLTKTGSGTLELPAATSYSGPIAVQSGTLVTTSAHSGGGAVTVADTATLALRLASAGGTYNASSFTLGATNGATLRLELGGFGNPSAPVITAPSFAVNGNNTLTLTGIGLSLGTFTLVDYTATIGGSTGFGGLTLTPIPRLGAMLVNNAANSRVDLQITNIDFPKWTGATNANWDIDNGGGTSTPNWREATSGTVTRYVESATMRDQVLFDDTATGPTTVNLTTTITPTGVTVNNNTKTYSFVGPGKLSGSTPLLKQGPGSLILANTGQNDYTGSTTITGGILQVGDGTNLGPGQLGTGPVINDATLVFNRLDNVTIPNNITGTGAISKINGNTVTLSGALTSSGTMTVSDGTLTITGTAAGPIAIGNTGTLALESPGVISGVISGSGVFDARGAGTKQLAGTAPNTFTSPTMVSEGLLQLNKTPGVNATNNDVQIVGTGQLLILTPDQIPDTATLTFNASGPSTVLGNETLANINVIGSSEATQLQANNGLNITGVLRIEIGVFSVASNHSATTGAVNITGGLLRIAANGNPSTLNVGTGGITASGGIIQVGQGGGAFDAVLNLGGDVTASGVFEFTRGNFFGAQRREINLSATRTFNITADETTVRPDIAGLGGLTKTGPGTLTLFGTNTYVGDTTINAGILMLNGTLSGSTRMLVNNGGTLSGTGPITTGPLGVTVSAGGKLSPGNGLGTLALNGTALDISGGADLTASGAFLFELDVPGLSDLVTVTGGALSIGAGKLEFDDFLFTPFPAFTQGTYSLFDGDQAIIGTFGPNRTGAIGGLVGTLAFGDGGRDIILQVVPEPTSIALLAGALTFVLGSRRRLRSAPQHESS